MSADEYLRRKISDEFCNNKICVRKFADTKKCETVFCGCEKKCVTKKKTVPDSLTRKRVIKQRQLMVLPVTVSDATVYRTILI